MTSLINSSSFSATRSFPFIASLCKYCLLQVIFVSEKLYSTMRSSEWTRFSRNLAFTLWNATYNYQSARRINSIWSYCGVDSTLPPHSQRIVSARASVALLFCYTFSIARHSHTWPVIAMTTVHMYVSSIKIEKVGSTNKELFSAPLQTNCTQLSWRIFSPVPTNPKYCSRAKFFLIVSPHMAKVVLISIMHQQPLDYGNITKRMEN